jgi:transcription factor WhiB
VSGTTKWAVTKPLPKVVDGLRCEAEVDLYDQTFESGEAFDHVREVAKAYCHAGDGCPVLDKCLQWALSRGEQGVWGGTDEAERRSMTRRQHKSVTRLAPHTFLGKSITRRNPNRKAVA